MKNVSVYPDLIRHYSLKIVFMNLFPNRRMVIEVRIKVFKVKESYCHIIMNEYTYGYWVDTGELSFISMIWKYGKYKYVHQLQNLYLH